MLSKTELQQNLQSTVIGNKLFAFESIDSTNACAKTLAEAGCEEGTVVVTEVQTAGKGRLGRTWTSDAETNLLFSIVLRPKINAEQAGMLSCKWPNDLLLNGKKCCGILLESSLTPTSVNYAIVGIGLNVNQTQFDKELETRATSLKLAAGVDVDRTALLKNIFEQFERYYAFVQANNWSVILNDWRQHTTMFGKETTLLQADQQIHGIARDITNDGGLVLETTSGAQVYYAGEVTLSNEAITLKS
jgi:BirA family biotin operon repressor/biotin-[acetyl-CoA-carboxylase] ligase